MTFGKRQTISAVIIFILILGHANFSVGGSKEKPEIWKFATIAPRGIGLGNSIQSVLIPAIEEGSENTIKIDVAWGGIMGDEADYQEKMRLGQIQGTGISGMAATVFCPEMAVLELPFLFDTWEEVDHIKKTMREQFEKLHEKYGYKLVAWNDQSFDQFYSTKLPLDKLEEFKKAKFGSWYGEIEAFFLKSLGATPIHVDLSEAIPAIREGAADAVIGPSFYIVASQMYPSVKYVNPVNARYSPAMILISLDVWNNLDERYRKRYFEQRADIEKQIAVQLRSDNDRCLKAMIKYGSKEVFLSPEEEKVVRDKAKLAWDHFAEKLYSRDLLDKVLSNLESFRKENK